MTDKLVIAELQNDGQYECMKDVDFPVTVAAIKAEGSLGVCVPFTEIWRITDNPITPDDQALGEPDCHPSNISGGMLYFSLLGGEVTVHEGRDHD